VNIWALSNFWPFQMSLKSDRVVQRVVVILRFATYNTMSLHGLCSSRKNPEPHRSIASTRHPAIVSARTFLRLVGRNLSVALRRVLRLVGKSVCVVIGTFLCLVWMRWCTIAASSRTLRCLIQRPFYQIQWPFYPTQSVGMMRSAGHSSLRATHIRCGCRLFLYPSSGGYLRRVFLGHT